MNDPTAGIPPAGLVLLGPRFRAGRDVDHVGGGVGHVGVERDLPLPVAAELQVCIPEVDGTGSGCVRERRSTTVSGTEGSDLLWYESLSDDESWFSLWSGYIRCVCRGIQGSAQNRSPRRRFSRRSSATGSGPAWEKSRRMIYAEPSPSSPTRAARRSSRSRSRSATPPSRPPSATWACVRTSTTPPAIGWGSWAGRREGGGRGGTSIHLKSALWMIGRPT